MTSIKDMTAIAGIGLTEYSKGTERTEWSLASEAIKLAADDAGIKVKDIDGLVKDIDDGWDCSYVQKTLGIDNLLYSSEAHWGTSSMLNAVTAVASGTANNVVYYRSRKGATSDKRSPSDYRVAKETMDDSISILRIDFYEPYGLATPQGCAAMIIQRYMHEYGVTAEQMGSVVTGITEYGAKNPLALYTDKPVTMDEYLNSEMTVAPLRDIECAPGVDAGIAILITRTEMAKNLKQKPAVIMSIAQGAAMEGEFLTGYNQEKMTGLPEMVSMKNELFQVAGVTPKDINVAQLDDRFAPMIPMQLEALGFCGKGEGAAFCADRKLPVNTAGGSLGEGFMDSNRIVEAVRQIRGTSTSQVDNAEIVLYAAGAGGPADGLILRK